MMLGSGLAVFITICVATMDTRAQSVEKCLEAYSSLEMQDCLQSVAKRATAELDDLVARLTTVLGPEEREIFERANRSWATYRADHCECAAKRFSGGSLESTTRITCWAMLIEGRLADLRKLYSDVLKASP